VPAAVSTYSVPDDNDPLHDTVAVPVNCVQPEALTAPCAKAMKLVVPFAATCNVTFAVGVPLCVRTHTLAVKEALFANTDVTLCAIPFHEAVRPVNDNDRLPPCTTLVFDARVPAPNTDQPVVPPSASALVNRFPLAAKATSVDTAASEASVRTTARPNERTVRFLVPLIVLLPSFAGRESGRC